MSKYSRCLLIALILVTVVAVAATLHESSGSDAATEPYVRGTNAYIFSETSTNYSELVYLSDKLPTTLNPSEWVRATDGYWYNVNQSNGDYGSILRYGAIVGITDDQIRQDIVNKYTYFTTSDFRLIQVDYTVTKACTFPITISHGSESKVFPVSENYSKSENGVTSYADYFSSSYESVGLFTVGTTSSVDFQVSEIRGTYSAHMECSADPGASKTWSSLSIPTDRVDLTGYVKDVDDSPIKGARVVYSEGAAGGEVYTDDAGLYTIHATYGKSVQITSVTKDGYNFGTISPGYNNDAAENNSSIHPEYHALEHSFTVVVQDQSSIPVVNAKVAAYWYYTDNGNVAADPLGKAGQKFMTDSEGKVILMFAEPPRSGALLYLRLESDVSSPQLSYDVHAMPSAGVPGSIPAASAITESGNLAYESSAYLDSSFFTTEKNLRVLESSTLVTVTSGNTSGAVPLSGIQVLAEWVFQSTSGPDYIITYEKGTAGATTDGTVFVSGNTDSEGKVRIYYKAPEFTTVTGKEVFLLIRGVNNSNPATIEQSFTFDCHGQINLPYDSTPSHESLDTLVTSMNGAVAANYGSIATAYTLKAVEDGFIVTATFAGDIPKFETDSVTLIQDGETTILAPQVAGSVVSFTAVVKGGMSLNFTINAEGYTFSPTKLALISDTTNVTITGTAANPTVFTREVPVKVLVSPTNPNGTVSIGGLSAGDIVKITYSSGRVPVTRNVISLAPTVDFLPLQVPAGMVTNFNASSQDHFTIKNDETAFTLYSLVQMNIVVYNGEAGSTPEISNVRPSVTITAVYGSEQWTAKTNSNGVATLTVPEIPQLTYKYGIYTLEGTSVTTGAYAGYTAFNLVGREPVVVDSYITLNLRYKVITNVSGDADSKDLMETDHLKLKVGDSITRVATPVEGLKFENWLLGGNLVSGNLDNSCTFAVTTDLDNLDLVAVYSAYEPPETRAPIDMTAVAIGLVGIIVAIVAFAYVFTQMRRY